MMESLAVIQTDFPLAGSGVFVSGDLRLQQRSLLSTGYTNTAYQGTVLNWTTAQWDPTASSWSELISSYMSRDRESP
jgi:hypothetical protein